MKQLLPNSYKLFFIIGLTFFLCTCKKGRHNDDPTPTPVTAKTVTFSNQTALPGDIITIKTSFKLDKNSWDITIGNKTVQLGKLSDTTAVFTTPYLAPGITTIDLTSLGIPEKSNFTISSYTPISATDAETITTAFNTNLSQEIDSITTTSDQNTLKMLQTAFNQKYALLTDDEKKEVAIALQGLNFVPPDVQKITDAHQLVINGLSNMNHITNFMSNPLKVEVPASINSEAEYYSAIITCGALYTAYGALSVLGATAVAVPTGVSQVIGAATMVYAFYLGTKGNKYRFLIKSYNGQNENVTSTSLLSRTVDDSQGNLKTNTISPVLKVTVAETINSGITFSKTATITINVNGVYNGLSTSGTGNAILDNFIKSLNDFVANYNKMIGTLNSIRSWFSSDPVLTPIKADLPATPPTETKSITAELISIENVSNPAISLTKTGTGTNIQLVAKSSTLTAPTPFTFDIVYKNKGLQITNRKTFNAVYDDGIYADKIEIVSGNNQIAGLGQQAPQPLVVKITDTNGKPVSNYKVEWQVATGGGELSASESTTNANGIAQVTWTSGSYLAQQSVTASAKRSDGTLLKGAPLTFTATENNLWIAALAGTWSVEQHWTFTTKDYNDMVETRNHNLPNTNCGSWYYTPLGNNTVLWGGDYTSYSITFKSDLSTITSYTYLTVDAPGCVKATEVKNSAWTVTPDGVIYTFISTFAISGQLVKMDDNTYSVAYDKNKCDPCTAGVIILKRQ